MRKIHGESATVFLNADVAFDWPNYRPQPPNYTYAVPAARVRVWSICVGTRRGMQKLNDAEKEPGNPFTVCNYISVGNYFKKVHSGSWISAYM